MAVTLRPGKLTITDPLRVRIVLEREDGTPFLDAPAFGTIKPGESVVWEYPKDGIEIKLGGQG